MLFSRPRWVAANSRAWIPPWEQVSVQWLLVGRQADLAMARSLYTRLWTSPWRIWSLPISLTRGPSEKAVEELWPGDYFPLAHDSPGIVGCGETSASARCQALLQISNL